MQNLSLAYRPQLFSDVVGQKETLTGLQNYLAQSEAPQSLLFAGPRGTGKTTTARLVVKTLNCIKEDSESRPCGKCDICQAVTVGNIVDMYELDGATNRGIDAIREIVEMVYHSPIHRFKIIIIDEAHMLTREASNALLKTLEEPPPGVLFILCTTEEHKLLPTIRSRLKIYRFRLISSTDIKSRLQYICEQEEIKFSNPDILDFVVAEGAGSMRDAIRTLDQVRELGEDVSMEQVLENVGLASMEQVGEFVNCLIVKDIPGAFKLIDTINRTADIVLFYNQLLEYLQQLLYLSLGLDVGYAATPIMTAQVPQINDKWVLATIRSFTNWAKQINPITRLGLEAAVVELIKQEDASTEANRQMEQSNSSVDATSTLSFIKKRVSQSKEPQQVVQTENEKGDQF